MRYLYTIFLLFSVSGLANAGCYHYWYYTDSQRHVRSPVPRASLGDFAGKTKRECSVRESSPKANYLTEGQYRRLVAIAAEAEGVDPNLVLSVIKAESAFNTNAVSVKGAKGLMQLMPATAEHYGVTDPFDPRQNINAGTALLATLQKKYSSLDLVLAAYNAGEKVVDEKGVPDYEETKTYIKRVKGYLNDLS